MASLNQELDGIFDEAIRKNAMGRQIDYGVSYAPIMAQDGQPTTVVVVVMRMKSIVIGEFITTSFFIGTPVPTFEQVEPSVIDAIAEMEKVQDQQQKLMMNATSLHAQGHAQVLPGELARSFELPH